MSEDDIRQIADEFLASYETRQPVDPPSTVHPDLTLEDAYAIQLRQAETRIARGARVIGHKVGLTSAPMQQALGVDEPDFGHLFDDMLCADGATIPAKRFLLPRAEPEIAFVLGRDLAGPAATLADAVNAISCCLPAIELIDSRVRDWKIGLRDTIADNGSSGGFVIGSTPRDVRDLDLRLIGCLLTSNGKVLQTGAGGAVLGNPLVSLVWLANELGRRGSTLRAGHIVMSGSFTAPIDIVRGDVVSAEFAGLGRVTAKFE